MDKRISLAKAVINNSFIALEHIVSNHGSNLTIIEQLEKRIDSLKEKLEYAKTKNNK